LSKAAAIEEGFRRAWPSIRDSNTSTIITAAILYFFTSSFVQGFAVTLLLGVLVSLFSAITTTRLFLRIFLKGAGVKS
jgi:preprotein translocase subunit SecD